MAMASSPYRGRQSGGYFHNSYSRRYSRSPARGSPYRPSERRRRSPPPPMGRDDRGLRRQRQTDRSRRYAPNGGRSATPPRGRQPTNDREIRPSIHRLPSDHPLVRELQELKRVREARIQDWIKLAQRLGPDWHHADSDDRRRFRDEERIATNQIEKVAGLIVLAERGLPLDQEYDRRPALSRPWERPLAQRPAPTPKKRKCDDETQVWTEKRAKTKVESWMKDNNAKALTPEKPNVPILIGSSDPDENIFLSDESDGNDLQAPDADSGGQNNGTETTKVVDAQSQAKSSQPSTDESFASTRDRADEFLESLAAEIPAKANTKLPPPPIVPISDFPARHQNKEEKRPSTDVPLLALQQNESASPNAEATLAEISQSNEGEFDLAAYLRWLNSGQSIPDAIRKPMQQTATEITSRSASPSTDMLTKERTNAVKTEPIDIKELLRALKPHGSS